jgi:MFS transporter, Spinster family, sphingosine-1-phosphate transporter
MSSHTVSAGKRAVTREAWIALVLLAAINLMNYYDRLLIVVVSEPLRQEFDLSDTQYGLLTGPAFVFVYAAASLLFGRLADTHDRNRIIGFAIALWSIMTALCGFAKSFAVLAIARAGIGIGEGGSNPAGMSLISDHFPPERRSTALALFQAGGMVGMLASFVLASQIAIAFGWRAVFLVAAAPGLLLAAAGFLLLKDPPRGGHDVGVGHEPPRAFVGTLGELWRNRAYRWLCAAACIGVFSSLGMLVWLPQFFIRYHGMGQREVGLLFGPAVALGLIAGMLTGGWLGDRMANRGLARPVIVCIRANLALVPVYLFALWTGSTIAALAGCFIGMALAVIYAPAFQATMQSVCTPRQRGTGSAASNVLNALFGQGMLVLFVGQLSDALAPAVGAESLRWALTASVSFTLLSGLLFIVAHARTRAHFAAMGDLSMRRSEA